MSDSRLRELIELNNIMTNEEAAIEYLRANGWLEKHDADITTAARSETWEAARRLDKMTPEEYVDVFKQRRRRYTNLIHHKDVDEVIEALRRYKDEKFEVGDEVVGEDGERFIVLYVCDNVSCWDGDSTIRGNNVFCWDGDSTIRGYNHRTSNLTKTGRSIPVIKDITKFLEEEI